MIQRRSTLLLLAAILKGLAASFAFAQGGAQTTGLRAEPAATELGLLVHATAVPGDAEALFLTTLDGHVLYWRPSGETERLLNLGGTVTAREGEQGMYATALHPDWSRNRRAFMSYTHNGTGDLVIAEYTLDPDDADASGFARELLRVTMPEPFHFGGALAFGPDGYLYIATGNGIFDLDLLAVEPFPSQDLTSLRGKILRIDVDAAQGYRVPATNPFYGLPDVRAEIFALGFRNPWKITFAPDGALIAVDVAQDGHEEVNVVIAGANYGWPLREGPQCFIVPFVGGHIAPGCDAPHFVDPVIGYLHLMHDPEGGNSVTGGLVTAGGPAVPAGLYVFGDFVSGRVWLADPAAGAAEWEYWSALYAPGTPWSGFVQAGDGTLYGHAISGGLYRLEVEAIGPDSP